MAAAWRKSSHSSSGDADQCVEVAALTDRFVAMRDSTDPGGPVLPVSPAAWTSLLTGIKSGFFDRGR